MAKREWGFSVSFAFVALAIRLTVSRLGPWNGYVPGPVEVE